MQKYLVMSKKSSNFAGFFADQARISVFSYKDRRTAITANSYQPSAIRTKI